MLRWICVAAAAGGADGVHHRLLREAQAHEARHREPSESVAQPEAPAPEAAARSDAAAPEAADANASGAAVRSDATFSLVQDVLTNRTRSHNDAINHRNPFLGRRFYVNPRTSGYYRKVAKKTSPGRSKSNLFRMAKLPVASWIHDLHGVRGHNNESLHGVLKGAAARSSPELVVLVWYNLPNRDCHTTASSGEICCNYKPNGDCDYEADSDCSAGIQEYKTTFVDPIIKMLKYWSSVPVAVIVEPDSIANLAMSNGATSSCGNQAVRRAYKEGIRYVVEQLTSETSASVYLDAGNGPWLGWTQNLQKYMDLVKEMKLPLHKVRGFATNVANYQPLGELCPWEVEAESDHAYRNMYCLGSNGDVWNRTRENATCCRDVCNLNSDWNSAHNALSYAQMVVQMAKGVLHMDSRVVIDTSRNGVKDLQAGCKNWCNVRGAGAGVAPTYKTGNPSIVDAYLWLKVPGQSDGPCISEHSLGSRHAEDEPPQAGDWFDYQAREYALHAQMG